MDYTGCQIDAASVVEVVRLLEGAGIEVWLHGGWGVDALLEEQTRVHKDLDLIVALSDVPRYQELLAGRGFQMAEGEPPSCFVMADAEARCVDVHPIAWDEWGNGIYRMENGEDWVYTASGFAGGGSIAGQRVRCLTPEYQMFLCHSGYRLKEKDFREMEALHERFGLELVGRPGR